MLKSLRIQNYRVFKDLSVDGLRRINLIAGKNNTGKTGFLEAVFLLSAGGVAPALAVNSAILRSSVSPEAGGLETVKTAWKHLFHKLDVTEPFEIQGEHSSLGRMRLSVGMEKSQVTQLAWNATNGASATDELGGPSLAMRYCEGDKPEGKGRVHLSEEGAQIEQSDYAPAISARLLLSRADDSTDYAALLGKLRTKKNSDFLLDALRAIEPEIQSVEDSVATGVPMIWCDVGLSEMVPLNVMGDSVARLARIALGISSVPGGILLVDEIENGMHHSVIRDVWKAIGAAAEKFDTQIFATTHSFECVEGAVDGLCSHDFRLYRLEAGSETCGGGPGANRLVTYSDEALNASIEFGFEVR